MDQIILSKQKIKELTEQRSRIENELKAHDKRNAEEGTFWYAFRDAAVEEISVSAKRRKLTELKLILQSVKELPKKVKSDKAVLGSYIILKTPEDNEVKYRLVHPLEAAPEKGLISTESPLGRSLLGAKKDEKIKCGERSYAVVAIK